MTRTHELDRDRTYDDARNHADAALAPGRSTRTQDLVGPGGRLTSGIVMRKARDANGVQPDADAAVASAASSSGRALPDHLRSKFETSLGADLSGVRVHDGPSSAQAARAVGAKAYALGSDIHFAAGQYDPASPSGELLLAHEVAHTVQQSGNVGRKAQFKLEVSTPGDADELAADRAADAMVSGQAATVTGASGLARRVMREPEGGKSEGGGEVGWSIAGSVPLGKHELGKGDVGPFELEGFIDGAVKWEAKKEAGTGRSSVSVPALHDGGAEKETAADIKVGKDDATKTEQAKVKLEVESKSKEKWGPLTPVWTGGAEGNKDSVGVNGTLTLEKAWGNGIKLSLASIKLNILDYKDGRFEPISLEAKSSISIPAVEIAASTGLKLKLSPEGSIGAKLSPDYKKVGEWVLRTFGGECLGDAMASAAAAGGAIAASVLIIVGGAIDVSEGNDIGKLCGDAYKDISDYATCYAAAIRGTAGGAAGPAGAKGFAQGNLDRIKLVRKYPTSMVDEQAEKAAGEVVSTATAKFKAEAEARFKANHAIMDKVRRGELPSDFEKVLDGTTKNSGVSSNGTIATDDVGRRKELEMSILSKATSLALAKVNGWGTGRTFNIGPEAMQIGTGMGFNLDIRRINSFDTWRPNPAELAGAQLVRAFDINGVDQYLASGSALDPHSDSTENLINSPAAAEAARMVADRILKENRVVGLFRRLPMKDDSDADRDAAADQDARDDAAAQRDLDRM